MIASIQQGLKAEGCEVPVAKLRKAGCQCRGRPIDRTVDPDAPKVCNPFAQLQRMTLLVRPFPQAGSSRIPDSPCG